MSQTLSHTAARPSVSRLHHGGGGNAAAAGPDREPGRAPSILAAAHGGDHLVQFYERDDYLVSSVAQFLSDGLTTGAAVVMVATAEHAAAVEQILSQRGVDVTRLCSAGRYLSLDATTLTAELTAGGAISSTVFERRIGQVIARLTAGGGHACVFGEVVSLLTERGDADRALELERLWNELAQRHPFTLLCGYRLSPFATSSSSGTFLHVCRAHTQVLPAEAYSAPHLTTDDRLREIAVLQQKAAALEAEITERQRTEEELRRRGSQLSALMEGAVMALHWVGPDGIILWANQAELDLVGYSREEYIGRHIAEFHADRPIIDDILGRLCRGEQLRNYEARLRCKDGKIKTVQIDSSVYREGDQFVHTQCFTRDISDQRLSERNSELLAAIVTSSDDAIVSKNLHGIVTSWNQSAERIFGFRADEMIGQPILKIIPPERHNEEPQILARIQRGERVDHFETVRRRKDGTPVEVSLTISPVKDGHGRIVGASKVARDITEKKQAERAVQALREQLAQANAELERRVQERTASLREAVAQMEEFSYTVSHDLRAPLRGMQVYSQALLEDYGPTLDREAQHCLARIAENATRLDKMVQEVLTFSRISRMDLKMEPLSLDAIVREIVQHYPQLQAPRVAIDFASLGAVLGHEPSLTQALSNLLLNGVKFVGPGVMPRLRLWTESREADQVRLWIEDNGIGVKPELQGRLFRMFERVHPHLPYEGTGVGLAIVRKAVTRMGGSVGIESDGMHGSRFWIQLPAAKPAS